MAVSINMKIPNVLSHALFLTKTVTIQDVVCFLYLMSFAYLARFSASKALYYNRPEGISSKKCVCVWVGGGDRVCVCVGGGGKSVLGLEILAFICHVESERFCHRYSNIFLYQVHVLFTA